MPLEPALRRRLSDAVSQTAAASAGERRTGGQVEAALGLMFRPGDRVVDMVTGLEGVVDAGESVASLVRAARTEIG